MDRDKIKTIVILHAILAVYSVCGILSKSAANVPFLGFQFCCYYAGMIVLLGVYAVMWQQIIKRLPLTVAYANKAVSVVWACIYGVFFFQEKLTMGKLIGGLLTIAGVILFALSDKEAESAENQQISAKSTNTVNAENPDKITPDTKKDHEEGM